MKRFNSSKWITENKHGKILTEGMSPEEGADAKEKERLNQHPEKDTINKIKKMMDKEKPQTEDYKPSVRAYNVIDKSNNDEIVAKELPRHKALELAKTNKDYMIDATDRLAETRPDYTPPPMGMGGEEKEDEEQDEYDKGWYGESKLLDRIKEKPTVEERTAVLNYWLSKSPSRSQLPDIFDLDKENYKGNDPLILSYIEKMDPDIPYRILRQENAFFNGELIRMLNHPDDQEYIQMHKDTIVHNGVDPFGNKLTPQNHDVMADEAKADPDLAETKTLKEIAIKLGYLKEIDGMEGDDDIIYRVGDKVSVLMRGTKAEDHQDAIITSIDTEDGVLRKTSKRTTLLSVYSEEEDLEDEVSTYDIRFYGFKDEDADGYENLRLDPEDMDDPDEDLVIIGSGYLDIKSNFGERPSQTNGEYAELGQKVVDQLHNGDKEAAIDYIMSQINEVDNPEDDYVDEVELEDLDFETLKSFFPKFYQKVKFTRTQPNGEEGSYYSDSISFPNLDDSTMEIGDSSALEDWKNKVLRRFGNVEIVFNDEAKNHFDRVFVSDDAFNDARDGFIRGKMSGLNR